LISDPDWAETGFEEVNRIGTDKSPRVNQIACDSWRTRNAETLTQFSAVAAWKNLEDRGHGRGNCAELILLVFNHLSGASTVSVLLDHASFGVM
jgi:hypothetical protein